MTSIETPRLRLRRAVGADLEAVHAMMSDARAMRYWSTPPHPDLSTTAAWFGSLTDPPDETRDEFVIEHAGRVVGQVGIWKMPEFGFMLHPDWWGRGFAAEALGAFVAHAFATHPIAALTADVDPRNTASLKLLEKLGFVETGRAQHTFLLPDGWSDSIYLALPRPQAAGDAAPEAHMADILSLSKARKAKARAAKEQQAAENRAKFGRTKAEKQRDAAITALTDKRLDDTKRDS